MTIHLPTLKKWAALKPPISARSKAKLAWRRFALVRVNGQPLAVPAKDALRWARLANVTEVELSNGHVYAQSGTSRIALKCWATNIPAEKPYDPREALHAMHSGIRDRVELWQMAGFDCAPQP